MNKKFILLICMVLLSGFTGFVFAQTNNSELNSTESTQIAQTNNSELNSTESTQIAQTNNSELNSTESTQIEEQVTCIFANSDEIQKCYTVDNSFYCSSTNEKQSCSIRVSGNNGEELGWLSSCGTYNITIIDGTDKRIEFDCSVSKEKAQGFGYAYAYYQCYDDTNRQNLIQIKSKKDCKSYKSWKSIADDLCKDKCGPAEVEIGKGIYENQILCGVKSFAVSQECNAGLLNRLLSWFKRLFGAD